MSTAEFNGLTTSEEVIDLFASRVEGRTFVITGTGAQGIGASTALALARAAPAHLVLVSRSLRTTQPLIEDLKIAAPNVRVTFVQCDLSDQDSVQTGTSAILEAAPIIDVLINNAGIMAIQEYTTDKKGNEIQLSANHVGHFLLTNLLTPALFAAASSARKEARVVNLTSAGHRISPFRFDDYNFSGGKTYSPWAGYGQSKTANILFSVALHKRLHARGVTSTAVHPGNIWDTGLPAHMDIQKALPQVDEVALRETGRKYIWDVPRRKTKSQGASTTLVAALDPGVPAVSPAYLENCQVSDPYEYALDRGNAERLWKISEELVGRTFDY